MPNTRSSCTAIVERELHRPHNDWVHICRNKLRLKLVTGYGHKASFRSLNIHDIKLLVQQATVEIEDRIFRAITSMRVQACRVQDDLLACAYAHVDWYMLAEELVDKALQLELDLELATEAQITELTPGVIIND